MRVFFNWLWSLFFKRKAQDDLKDLMIYGIRIRESNYLKGNQFVMMENNKMFVPKGVVVKVEDYYLKEQSHDKQAV